MEIKSKIQFVDEKIKKEFKILRSSNNKELSRALDKTLREIQDNAFCGIQIPKRLIPKEYLKKYNIRNLWKLNLTKSWRLLYSIESNGIIVIAIILEWMDHKEYERKFKY
jgi:Txe/YoeB family toxin of Txe-Axe toxin-antitoxin module|tara:strand:+ start:100 stop:429 length:330 start_codon:yes stop_codon:yes gene_type:complete